jgi:AmmeMemoRadiSam system protein A
MFELEPGEQLELLVLARSSLESFFQTGAIPSYKPRYAALLVPRGVFVSLHRGPALRGCVGQMSTRDPLHRAVSEMALAAAFSDPRFAPVQRAELTEILIEISVLSELVPLRSPEEIEIGKHGLLLSLGTRRGLLLPQVAAEHGWDAVRFLEETCGKAGVNRDAWRLGAVVEKFSAQVFDESRRHASSAEPQAAR